MNIDDPRHGTYAGRVAGCNQECCRKAAARAKKQRALRFHREGPQTIPATTLLERINWWQDRGVTCNALGRAAGLSDSHLGKYRNGIYDTTLKSTERAVLAVTWAHLPDNASVNANVTLARLHSLMAAGHTLTWLESITDGIYKRNRRWTSQTRVPILVARTIQAVYNDAPDHGPGRQTASRARNAGYLPMAAWDDPGQPAMPSGWEPTGEVAELDDDFIDEAVVQRVLVSRVQSTDAERKEVCRRWVASGRPLSELEQITGWRACRYYRLSDMQAVA